MTAKEHAEAIIANYTSHGLGNPRQSTDHAVAVAVAYLDLSARNVCSRANGEDMARDFRDLVSPLPSVNVDWRNGDSDNTKRLKELLAAQAATVSKSESHVRIDFETADEANEVFVELSR